MASVVYVVLTCAAAAAAAAAAGERGVRAKQHKPSGSPGVSAQSSPSFAAAFHCSVALMQELHKENSG